jgi:ATP adenylyltransferase
MTYIQGGDEKREGCFFCEAWKDAGDAAERLLLVRSGKTFVMLNRYPYSNAHLLVAPARHFGVMEEADDGEGAELWRVAARAKRALSEALSPDGFNVGVNQGRVAGAGVLDHLHIHIVPRWNGDVNFMPVFADVRVIPQALEETRGRLLPFFQWD